jgi:hypothetical protein
MELTWDTGKMVPLIDSEDPRKSRLIPKFVFADGTPLKVAILLEKVQLPSYRMRGLAGCTVTMSVSRSRDTTSKYANESPVRL